LLSMNNLRSEDNLSHMSHKREISSYLLQKWIWLSRLEFHQKIKENNNILMCVFRAVGSSNVHTSERCRHGLR